MSQKYRRAGVYMSNFEKFEYWLELCDDDLETAIWLLKGSRLLHCGYFCHQIAEKAFKAAISKNTGEIQPKIHDLPKLAANGNLYDKLSKQHLNLLDKLKSMQIEARYPEYKEAISQTLNLVYYKELFDETEDLLCWIKQQLEK